MDEGSVNGAAYLGISSSYCYGPFVPMTVSWSVDQSTIFFVPATSLAASTTYYLSSYSLTDLAGNSQQNFCIGFTTASGSETAGPVVLQVSPPSGFTGVPINAPVQILFNEAISPASLAGVMLNQGSSVVPAALSLFDGNKGIQLLPQVPLASGTVYTINVTGVVDITGNAQSSFPSQSFTTGTGIDLTPPTIVSTSPTNGQTNVGDNTTIMITFSEAMDAASFDPNSSFHAARSLEQCGGCDDHVLDRLQDSDVTSDHEPDRRRRNLHHGYRVALRKLLLTRLGCQQLVWNIFPIHNALKHSRSAQWHENSTARSGTNRGFRHT